jgi:hypothetical protein
MGIRARAKLVGAWVGRHARQNVDVPGVGKCPVLLGRKKASRSAAASSSSRATWGVGTQLVDDLAQPRSGFSGGGGDEDPADRARS